MKPKVKKLTNGEILPPESDAERWDRIVQSILRDMTIAMALSIDDLIMAHCGAIDNRTLKE